MGILRVAKCRHEKKNENDVDDDEDDDNQERMVMGGIQLYATSSSSPTAIATNIYEADRVSAL